MNSDMRIISLVPSATEIVYLLGLQDWLVGRSHDSDFPAKVRSIPIVSDSLIPDNLSSSEIDRYVKNSQQRGRDLYHLDEALFHDLRPTLVLTQELCGVCAPSFAEVEKMVRITQNNALVLSLEPDSLEGVIDTVRVVGKYAGIPEVANEKANLLERRLERIEDELAEHGLFVEFGGEMMEEVVLGRREPTVAVIEWMDPLMTAGHWVPDMVERAGGHMVLSEVGAASQRVEFGNLRVSDPDVIILAICGFEMERTKQEMHLLESKPGWGDLKAVRNGRVYIVDDDSYFTRNGPRLIDGVEMLAKILHPDIFGPYEINPQL